MGIQVTEDELRIYLLCANPERLDMDKVKTITPTKGASRPALKTPKKPVHDSSSEDDFDFSKAVRQYSGDSNKGRPPRLSNRIKTAKAAPPTHDDSSDESDGDNATARIKHEVEKRLQAVEWQQLYDDITRLIRATGSHIKPPKAGTPITDMRRIKDYLAKEADIPTSVESTLNFFLSITPMIESFVVTNVPFIKLQGWSNVLQSTRDFMRGPLESMYRTHMLSFGYSMTPGMTLIVIVIGSMVVTCLANMSGKNPTTMSNTVLTTFGGLFGLTPTTARTTTVSSQKSYTSNVMQPPPPPTVMEPSHNAGNYAPPMAPPPF